MTEPKIDPELEMLAREDINMHRKYQMLDPYTDEQWAQVRRSGLAIAAMEKLRPFRETLYRSLASSGWQIVRAEPTEEMVVAGMEVQETARRDLENYVSGETIDWDDGMIAEAKFKAMSAASPKPLGWPEGK